MSLSVCSIPWTYFNSSVKDCDGTITFIDSVTDLSETGYLLSCAIPFEENDGKTNWVNCKDSYESVLKQDITASHIFYDFVNPVIVNTYVKGDEGGLTNYSGQDFLDTLTESTETTYFDESECSTTQACLDMVLTPTIYAVTFAGFFTLVATFHLVGIAIRNILKKLN